MQLSSGLPDPSVTGSFRTVRTPRLRVLANGAIVPGAFEAEVLNNSYFAADRFRLGLALSADPARGAAWWAEQDQVVIDIAVSLGGDYVNLLHGAVDSVEIDLLGDAVRLTGRDLSAQLIEARAQGTFANQTSSEIATALAGRHGLSADVQATTTPVGRYWQLEHDSLVLDGFARATTEWDLLVALAQYEGFDVWVQGTTLHFRAADTAGGADGAAGGGAERAAPGAVADAGARHRGDGEELAQPDRTVMRADGVCEPGAAADGAKLCLYRSQSDAGRGAEAGAAATGGADPARAGDRGRDAGGAVADAGAADPAAGNRHGVRPVHTRSIRWSGGSTCRTASPSALRARNAAARPRRNQQGGYAHGTAPECAEGAGGVAWIVRSDSPVSGWWRASIRPVMRRAWRCSPKAC